MSGSPLRSDLIPRSPIPDTQYPLNQPPDTLKLLRITTVPISLQLLLTGQMRFLRENGLEVIMVSADGPQREQVMQAEGCPHRIVPMTRAITPAQDLRSLGRMWDLIRREKPDIVHTHTPKAGLLGMWAAWLAGVPVRIHTVAGMPLETARGRRRWLLLQMERLTAFFATEVWPNSPALVQAIEKEKICPPRKIRMLGSGSTNGIDLAVFAPEALQEDVLQKIKRELAWQPDHTYLLFVGRLVRDKGIVELAEAFSALAEAFPDLHLILLGEAEKERSSERLPDETLRLLETHPRIHLRGWVDEVAEYLALADFLVHPSHREGFPNVLLQAGALACPIICSDITGNRNLIADESRGLLFRLGDAHHLAEKVREALTQPEQQAEKAKELQIRIRERYDRQKMHRLYLEAYRGLLHPKPER